MPQHTSNPCPSFTPRNAKGQGHSSGQPKPQGDTSGQAKPQGDTNGQEGHHGQGDTSQEGHHGQGDTRPTAFGARPIWAHAAQNTTKTRCTQASGTQPAGTGSHATGSHAKGSHATGHATGSHATGSHAPGSPASTTQSHAAAANGQPGVCTISPNASRHNDATHACHTTTGLCSTGQTSSATKALSIYAECNGRPVSKP